MSTALILLVGEQPVPNLLPTRHLQPDVAVLVHSTFTRLIAERLKNLLERGEVKCPLCEVDPYDFLAIQSSLQQFLDQNLGEHESVFNLTGGTKPMALAAFLLAFQRKSDFLYFQTESGHSKLYRYGFGENREVVLREAIELSETITLDEYLRLYVGNYQTGEPRNDFEEQVRDALRTIPDLEMLTSVRPQGLDALEVDFVVRLGNQVGVIEAKTRGAKAGIDQINAVAEPRYLGTYVHKFLVSSKPVDQNNKNLAKAYKIEVIELPSYSESGHLNDRDKETLRERIVEKLRR